MGDEIDYYVKLTDVNGDVLQDAGWNGLTWLVETQLGSTDPDTIKTFPASGMANITHTVSTSGLEANQYYQKEFMVASYLNGTKQGDSIIVASDPVLITHSLDDLSTYTHYAHVAISYDLTLEDLTESQQALLKGQFHNKLESGRTSNQYFISNIEIYSGSIIFEASIYGKTKNSLETAMTDILDEVARTESFQGLSFEFDTVGCNLQTMDTRVLGTKTLDTSCYGSNTGSGLEGWAIALIVICALIALLIVAFIAIVVSNRNKNQKKHHLHMDN